jgi:hypothetical protein
MIFGWELLRPKVGEVFFSFCLLRYLSWVKPRDMRVSFSFLGKQQGCKDCFKVSAHARDFEKLSPFFSRRKSS